MPAAKKDYHEMPDEDLHKELDALMKGLFNLRVRKVTDVVENPAAFRQHRREIARIKTELRARELAAEKKALPKPERKSQAGTKAPQPAAGPGKAK